MLCFVVVTHGVDVGFGDGTGVPYNVIVCVSEPAYANVLPAALGFGAGVGVAFEVGAVVGRTVGLELPPPPQAESAKTVSGTATKPNRQKSRSAKAVQNLHCRTWAEAS